MTTATVTRWALQIDRGPDWLFVRPQPPAGQQHLEVDLADSVYQVLEEHLTHRLVLDLEEIGLLRSWMIGQLMLLHKRIGSRGGVLRICNLSPENEETIHICQLQSQLPNYPSRLAAVTGVPTKPR